MKYFNRLSSDKNRVIENYFYLTIIQGLNYILPFIVVPFLVRQLGVSNFGLVMFAQSMMVFFVIFTEFGFNTTATREIANLKKDNKDFSFVYFRVFWARITLILLAFIILFLITISFDKFREHQSLYLLSYGIVVGQAIFPVWFFQGIEKMKYITIINVVAKMIFTVLLLFFITQPDDFILVPIFNSIGFIVAGVLSLLISLRSVSWQWPDFKGGKIFYKESFYMFISGFSSSMATSLNVFLLGIFGGDFLVGVYSSFEKLILAAKNMFIPIYQALYPFMSRQSLKKTHDFMKKVAPGILILGALITGVFYFFADFILNNLYGDPVIVKYSYLFKIMGFIAIISGLHMLYDVLYAPATKQFKKVMWLMIAAGLFNLIISLVIVPIYNIQGTVVAAVITELLLLALCSFFYWKDLKKFSFNLTKSS